MLQFQFKLLPNSNHTFFNNFEMNNVLECSYLSYKIVQLTLNQVILIKTKFIWYSTRNSLNVNQDTIFFYSTRELSSLWIIFFLVFFFMLNKCHLRQFKRISRSCPFYIFSHYTNEWATRWTHFNILMVFY